MHGNFNELVEIDDDEYFEEISFARTPSFETPVVLHLIFRFSEIEDVARMTRVSRTFREVGTSDFLWRDIVLDINNYLPSDENIVVRSFDIKDVLLGWKLHGDGDYYNTFRKMLKVGFDRNITERKWKKIYETILRNKKEITWYILAILTIFSLSNCFCPCLGILVTGSVAVIISATSYREKDDLEQFYFSVSDIVITLLCQCCGFSFVSCILGYFLTCGYGFSYCLFCLPCFLCIPQIIYSCFAGYCCQVGFPVVWLTKYLDYWYETIERVEYYRETKDDILRFSVTVCSLETLFVFSLLFVIVFLSPILIVYIPVFLLVGSYFPDSEILSSTNQFIDGVFSFFDERWFFQF